MALVNASDEFVELLISVDMAASDGSKQASDARCCERPAAGATLTANLSEADHRHGKTRPRQ